MINLNGIYSRDLLKNNRTRMALAILSGTKCSRGNRDSYVRSASREAAYSTYDKYSVTIRVITKGEYTPEILDLINFHYDDICRNKGSRVDDYIIGCKKYMKNEIPTIDPCRCGDIRAVHNTVTFDEGSITSIQTKPVIHIYLRVRRIIWDSHNQIWMLTDRTNQHII